MDKLYNTCARKPPCQRTPLPTQMERIPLGQSLSLPCATPRDALCHGPDRTSANLVNQSFVFSAEVSRSLLGSAEKRLLTLLKSALTARRPRNSCTIRLRAVSLSGKQQRTVGQTKKTPDMSRPASDSSTKAGGRPSKSSTRQPVRQKRGLRRK